MNSVSHVLLKSGSLVYVNIVEVVLVSIMWSILIVPAIIILPLQTAFVYLAFIAIPASAAAVYAINRRLNHEKNTIKLFWKGFFTLYRKSLLLSFFISLAVLIPLSTWWYYQSVDSSYALFIFSVFQTYLCVMFLLTQMYSLTLIAVHGSKTMKAMNQSIRYFLKYPWYTIIFFIQVISITALLAVTFIGFFLLYVGIISLLIRTSALNVMNGFSKEQEKKEKEQTTYSNSTLRI
ncbi:hypothetical protein [Jeotgalibacillus soli]|uniref:Uncharacterized protein n=1 Tax=Jeotgalibacillus soli TaxID=889306 RepID=A0A0C2RHB6_9BACL|nr:hypothetical protein [Jeotgalibacillus soli]KIL49545.1 hypothetical protein KP78_10130 [Jeotgalibacillus soli]